MTAAGPTADPAASGELHVITDFFHELRRYG